MLRKTFLVALSVGLALGCGGASSGAPGSGTRAPATTAVDIAPVRDDLQLYQDGKGHYIALVEPDPEKQPSRDLMLFWGDGKLFHAVKVSQATADGLKFEIGFQDARIPLNPAGQVKRERGKTELECWGEHVELSKLTAEKASPVLAAAHFQSARSDWAPVALGKNGDEYLYIDHGQTTELHNTYRVFQGKKGSLRKVDVSEAKWDDGSSTLNIKTADGKLTVVRDDGERTEYTLKPAWDGKKGDFSALPRAKNWHLIFEELGVYEARPAPTPCDLMLP
jgi:hypothetical protein